MKLKPSRNGKITQSFTDIRTYIMPKSRISNVANMSFNAIRKNKILAKIFEFTILGFKAKSPVFRTSSLCKYFPG